MSIDTILIYVLIAVAGISLAEILRLNNRIKRLTLGKQGADLEETLNTLVKGMENLDGRAGEIEDYIVKMDHRLQKSVQKVHTVRFNPFRDQGGNQSFATCFLDERGDGVVFSSLYARDKVSVYAKPIQKYQSDYELSEEEKEAIDKAK